MLIEFKLNSELLTIAKVEEMREEMKFSLWKMELDGNLPRGTSELLETTIYLIPPKSA